VAFFFDNFREPSDEELDWQFKQAQEISVFFISMFLLVILETFPDADISY